MLLRELGFDVWRVASTVLLGGGDAGECHPFDHLTLVVRVADRQYLSDVGFGDCSLAPLALDEEKPQTDGRAQYRVTNRGGHFQLDRLAEVTWEPLHRLEPTPRDWSEFAARCAYLQSSPESKFTQKRLCVLIGEHGPMVLSGNSLQFGGEQTMIPEHEYHETLRQRFNIDLGGAKWVRPRHGR